MLIPFSWHFIKSNRDGKLLELRAALPECAVDFRTFFVLCEQRARLFLVAVDFPNPGALTIVRAVVDEVLHILRRVAEKQSHLVRKLSALASFERLLVSIL